MLILGLNHGELNSSAALYKDGKIIAGATEERFNREKMTTQFPRQVVEFCLQYAGIEFNEIDCIAQGWNPGAGWHNYNPLLSSNRIKREDYFPFEGVQLKEIVKMLSKKYGLEDPNIDEIIAKKEENYMKNSSFKFYDGVQELIESLVKRGIKILKVLGRR